MGWFKRDQANDDPPPGSFRPHVSTVYDVVKILLVGSSRINTTRELLNTVSFTERACIVDIKFGNYTTGLGSGSVVRHEGDGNFYAHLYHTDTRTNVLAILFDAAGSLRLKILEAEIDTSVTPPFWPGIDSTYVVKSVEGLSNNRNTTFPEVLAAFKQATQPGIFPQELTSQPRLVFLYVLNQGVEERWHGRLSPSGSDNFLMCQEVKAESNSNLVMQCILFGTIHNIQIQVKSSRKLF